uniref:Uncharacterized protein n=1 Tax=Rhizophora mucronata TaxID=61149 RepID=A0A2P2PV13_RHIMU
MPTDKKKRGEEGDEIDLHYLKRESNQTIESRCMLVTRGG